MLNPSEPPAIGVTSQADPTVDAGRADVPTDHSGRPL